MFLQAPFHFFTRVQNTVLIVNTVLLVVVLIVVELVYSETPKEKRQHLKYFLPIILVFLGILIYAVYKQAGNG
jgi:dipeptide/tripeptide permease